MSGGAGITAGSPKAIIMIAPVGTSEANAQVASCRPVISAGIRRLARSRRASAATATTASSDAGAKPPRPGWMISITPAKPTAIAAQRRHPTGSPRNSAAPSVTASGVACRIADALDSVVSTRAVMKLADAMTSPRLRSSTGVDRKDDDRMG
ncbi:MAG: hypothetical protein U5K33_08515 [Halofilum sp. (in: g-proteobacteria)]|nr:hypothetical protein [Halofilum sp. (in: g-proteobacteria)]